LPPYHFLVVSLLFARRFFIVSGVLLFLGIVSGLWCLGKDRLQREVVSERRLGAWAVVGGGVEGEIRLRL
jgi:hypothetical protein